ncbi:uncharacterized protein LOC110991247 [Acanthaster planci]|uniref:Uncharacterized protein LOC110991247 n=1 Tax=Acanthaster planci TaxID=133434 RepID=A0A8B8A3F0_ACAPL|nr:uncharacterized protein LOC110991247 [Acanthaster planci]
MHVSTLLLLVLVAAVGYYVDGKNCCFPSRYRVSTVGGIFYDPGSIKPRLEIAAIVARDAARNVVGTKRKSAEVETGKKWVTRKVKKFDAKTLTAKVWTILTVGNETTCRLDVVPGVDNPCIPDSFTRLEPIWYGNLTGESLMIDRYQLKSIVPRDGSDEWFEYTVFVAPKPDGTCVLTNEMKEYTTPDGVAGYLRNYGNFSVPKTDAGFADLFYVPEDICPMELDVAAPKNLFEEYLKSDNWMF